MDICDGAPLVEENVSFNEKELKYWLFFVVILIEGIIKKVVTIIHNYFAKLIRHMASVLTIENRPQNSTHNFVVKAGKPCWSKPFITKYFIWKCITFLQLNLNFGFCSSLKHCSKDHHVCPMWNLYQKIFHCTLNIKIQHAAYLHLL